MSLKSLIFKSPAFLLLACLALGCQPISRSSGPIEKCPDGVVERLTVSESGAIELAEGRFLELVNRDDQMLVMVDFGTTWCGYCKILAPSLDRIKKSWGDKLEIIKVDGDSNPRIAEYMGVTGYPDVRIFRNGKQVGDFVGAVPQADIESLLKSLQ